MSEDIRDLDSRFVWHPFTQSGTAPPPLVAVKAEGAVITDDQGRDYLDLVSSWWVNLHGHAHPAIARAVAEQAAAMEQVIFADFTHAPAARLAARIAALLPGDLSRAFFSDDGSTAVEVALKIAMQYWRNLGQTRTEYVAFDGGYHGDTVGAMSVGRSSGFFRAWDPLLFPVAEIPFPATWDGDPEPEAAESRALIELERILEERGDRIAAVIVEPLIQGAGGMRMCRPEFLRRMEERVRAAGVLTIYDEVMTGFGRTGAPFACVTAGTRPDLICLSKGLTGGFTPMGLTVCREEIHQAFVGQELERAFLHGHSYTANPIGCAAGLASLDILESADCAKRIAAIEDIHRHRLPGIASRHGALRPRVCGTVAALDLAKGGQGYGADVARPLKKALMDRGLLLRPLGNVLYFLPPYCIDELALHRAWDIVDGVLASL